MSSPVGTRMPMQLPPQQWGQAMGSNLKEWGQIFTCESQSCPPLSKNFHSYRHALKSKDSTPIMQFPDGVFASVCAPEPGGDREADGGRGLHVSESDAGGAAATDATGCWVKKAF